MRQDTMALAGGVVFSALFTAVIAALGHHLSEVPHPVDTGASLYVWKLLEPTTASRVSSWVLYLLHQFGLWGMIFWAQRNLPRRVEGLHRLHWAALGWNALFVLLHLVQTHVWYDGLAQDVSLFSSLGAVVVLLIWILILENPRRGVLMGKKLPMSKALWDYARRTHGYYFSWAIVYTFWYHPMEATPGHLWGFFYTFLLLLQSSLFMTRVHTNRWWTITLEVLVLVHGTMVAVMQGKGMWPMFAFGFGGMFVLTQMHGLGWSRLTRAGVIVMYGMLAGLVYSEKGLNHLNEIIRIPMIDFFGLLLLTLILGGLMRLGRWFSAEA